MVGAISGCLLRQARSLSTLTNYTGPLTTTLWSSSAKHTLCLGNEKKSPGTQQQLPYFGWSSVKRRSDFDVRLRIFLISILWKYRNIGENIFAAWGCFLLSSVRGCMVWSHMWNTQECYSSFTRLTYRPQSGVTRASAGHNLDSLVEEQAQICTATAFNHMVTPLHPKKPRWFQINISGPIISVDILSVTLRCFQLSLNR